MAVFAEEFCSPCGPFKGKFTLKDVPGSSGLCSWVMFLGYEGRQLLLPNGGLKSKLMGILN